MPKDVLINSPPRAPDESAPTEEAARRGGVGEDKAGQSSVWVTSGVQAMVSLLCGPELQSDCLDGLSN